MALIVAVCGATVVVVGLASWRTIVEEYHLSRLRGDPRYALGLVEEDPADGSPADRALVRFLESEKGRTWFAETLWTEVFSKSLESVPSEIALKTPPTVGHVYDRGNGNADGYWGTDSQLVATTTLALSAPEARGCFRLLRRISVQLVPVPSRPEWVLTVRKPGEKEVIGSFKDGPKTLARLTAPPDRPLCFVERATSSPP